jgi:hypothetical protein
VAKLWKNDGRGQIGRSNKVEEGDARNEIEEEAIKVRSAMS